MSDTNTVDAQEQLTRIERMNAETRKFVEEALKLSAEARKLNRDASFAPFTIIIGASTAGAALFGAGVAFVKLLGH